MRFRKLRIAWSATCLIACVLLIVLWVRSYWWEDLGYCQILRTPRIGFISNPACLLVGIEQTGDSETRIMLSNNYLPHLPWRVEEIETEKTASGFNAEAIPGGCTLGMPHYFAVVVVSA